MRIYTSQFLCFCGNRKKMYFVFSYLWKRLSNRYVRHLSLIPKIYCLNHNKQYFALRSVNFAIWNKFSVQIRITFQQGLRYSWALRKYSINSSRPKASKILNELLISSEELQVQHCPAKPSNVQLSASKGFKKDYIDQVLCQLSCSNNS